MNDYLPDWIKNLLDPIEPSGVPSINKYAGKRLEDLENDPTARLDALNALERGPAPEPAPDDAETERKRQIIERLNNRQKTLDQR